MMMKKAAVLVTSRTQPAARTSSGRATAACLRTQVHGNIQLGERRQATASKLNAFPSLALQETGATWRAVSGRRACIERMCVLWLRCKCIIDTRRRMRESSREEEEEGFHDHEEYASSNVGPMSPQ